MTAVDFESINIKKDLIRKVGQAKQCQLCGRIFSSEYKAIDHVLEDHKSVQQEDLRLAVRRKH